MEDPFTALRFLWEFFLKKWLVSIEKSNEEEVFI